MEVAGYGATDSSGHLTPLKFTRRVPGPEDVTLRILYCGVCATDLHQIKNDFETWMSVAKQQTLKYEWATVKYPMVPGHEIIGTVTGVGEQVPSTTFAVGDTVGVGCLLGSCRECDSCGKGVEQYCPSMVLAYNDLYPDGSRTQGGFSSLMICDHRYVVKVPENLAKDAAAPLLCAGTTVWSPMQYFGMNVRGAHFGVVGLGGLGHIAAKFAKAFGMHVTIFSTSPSKEKEARLLLGADDFVVSKDVTAMQAKAESIDFIIDTVAVKHPLDPYLATLKTNGKLCMVGVPLAPHEFTPFLLNAGRKLVAGSLIGGIQETKEMLEFCGTNNITCLVETLPVSKCNEAMDRLEKNDVKYRFVLDMTELHCSLNTGRSRCVAFD